MAAARLFHVSESRAISRFVPRPDARGRNVVWAISECLLTNYLLPRDCPRVTFYARPESSHADVERLLRGARHVVAIEASWLERVEAAHLYAYELPDRGFALEDPIAGYYTATGPVAPLTVTEMSSLPRAIAERGSELRVLPSLWALHDAVARSSLGFSIIRMRNATPRD